MAHCMQYQSYPEDRKSSANELFMKDLRSYSVMMLLVLRNYNSMNAQINSYWQLTYTVTNAIMNPLRSYTDSAILAID